jgi:hypothetical protein
MDARFYYDAEDTAKWKPGKVASPPPQRTTFEGQEYEAFGRAPGAWGEGEPLFQMYRLVEPETE